MHPKSAGMSDNAIAKHVGVAQSTVSDWRQKTAPALKESLSETQSPRDVSNMEPQKRLCADGRMMNTANIGRSPSSTAVRGRGGGSEDGRAAARRGDCRYWSPQAE